MEHFLNVSYENRLFQHGLGWSFLCRIGYMMRKLVCLNGLKDKTMWQCVQSARHFTIRRSLQRLQCGLRWLISRGNNWLRGQTQMFYKQWSQISCFIVLNPIQKPPWSSSWAKIKLCGGTHFQTLTSSMPGFRQYRERFREIAVTDIAETLCLKKEEYFSSVRYEY